MRVVLNEIDDIPAMASALPTTAGEEVAIDALMMDDPKQDDNDPERGLLFFDALSSCAEYGNFMISISSTFASELPDIAVISDETNTDDCLYYSGGEEDWVDVMEDDLDEYMASAVASFASGVTPEHLSKVWRISHEEAKQTIENTSQLSVRPKDPTLSRNCGTNNRMLQDKRIKEYF